MISVMNSLFFSFADAVKRGQLIALATIVKGQGCGNKLLVWPDGRSQGGLGESEDDRAGERQIVSRASELLAEQRSELIEIGAAQGVRSVFIEVYAPPPKLIIIGAVHVAIPLVSMANLLGFETIVIDARSAFATPERFAHTQRLILEWPEAALAQLHFDPATYFVTLTHDDKFDTPALAYALRQPTRYIGALGSKKTHANRVAALKELGLSDMEIARIHAPIGLDLGGKRPEEIAVAIIAEIVAAKNGKRLL
jgi:xanthine dehydrogenase accessory factor